MSIFGGFMPKPPPPPPPPAPDQPEVRQKQDDAINAMRKIKGRAATILTGGKGLMDKANVSRRTLLGA